MIQEGFAKGATVTIEINNGIMDEDAIEEITIQNYRLFLLMLIGAVLVSL